MKFFFNRPPILIGVLGFLLSLPISAQDFATFAERRQAMLKSLSDAELNERGKHGLPKACARLWNNPNDTVALKYITTILNHKVQSMFDFPGVALALHRYGKSFSPDQMATIKANLERLAKDDKKGGEGFLGHGTENHALLMWTSAYLFGQYFPDAKWVNGMTSEQLMADMKERMRTTFHNVYRKGYAEYLSTTYEVVMNFPVAILLEYAIDPEIKSMAEAYLLYKWSLSSLNNYEGYIMAPLARMNTEQDLIPDFKYGNPSATNYYNWLLWGWGPKTSRVDLSHFQDKRSAETSYAIYVALSNIIPDPVFFQIADGKAMPYSHKSSASSFGPYAGERARPHLMMRSLYRHKQYAIGTGNFRWVPGGDYADNDNYGFSIVWHSADRFNFLGVGHPFWYSDEEDKNHMPDTWKSISPFQQTAHFKNAAIVLFNIPQKDPWPAKSSAAKWAWRDAHANDLLKRGMVRFPKSVDEVVEADQWVFLREGRTYIGIRPLKDYYKQDNLEGKGLDDFILLKSDHAKTGFVFEMGTEDDFGSFKNFQGKLAKNLLTVNWDQMNLSYKSAGGDLIRMQFNDGLPFDADSLARSVPSVWFNGKPEITHDKWPLIESPFINMDQGKLDIQTNNGKITVDWTDKYPSIKRGRLDHK